MAGPYGNCREQVYSFPSSHSWTLRCETASMEDANAVTASVLDDAGLYERLDPSGMRHRLRSLGQQCWDAYRQALRLPLPMKYRKVRSMVLAGMGGSAAGGSLLADLAVTKGMPLPVTTWRDFGLPPWVGRETLALVSSYSGETEEALSAFHAALERSACPLVLTSGGTLGHLAQRHGVPAIQVTHQGEPRTAVGWSLAAPLAVLEALRLFPAMGDEVEAAARLVESQAERYSENAPEARNLAKALAGRLHGRLPVIYGAGLLSAVARRWKTDINENAKSWAVAETLPELGHNVSTAYELPGLTRQSATVLLLRSSFQHPRTGLRFQVIGELLNKAGVPHTSVHAQGQEPMSHLLGSLFLGGWVSYYLGLLYGMDPSATPGIDYVKRRLAAREETEEWSV